MISNTPSFHLRSEAVERQTQGLGRWRWKYQLMTFKAAGEYDSDATSCTCTHATTYCKLQALPRRKGIGLWIFREEREREESLFKHSWILHQKNDPQVRKIRKESVAVPYWKAFAIETWRVSKNHSMLTFSSILLSKLSWNVCWRQNVYFPRSTSPYMEEIFLPHALWEKIVRIFRAFLTASSSPVLLQRKTGDLSNWHI